MHPRRQLRALAKDRLLNATMAEGRVWATITPPISVEDTVANEGPVLLVYIRDEEIRHEDYPTAGVNSHVRRRLTLEVAGSLVGGDNIDDRLDDFAEEIEALLEDWEPEGFLSARIELKDTELLVVDKFERSLGMIFMTYEIAYYTPYRVRPETDEFADDVLVSTRGDAPEHIVDDDEDGLP